MSPYGFSSANPTPRRPGATDSSGARYHPTVAIGQRVVWVHLAKWKATPAEIPWLGGGNLQHEQVAILSIPDERSW